LKEQQHCTAICCCSSHQVDTKQRIEEEVKIMPTSSFNLDSNRNKPIFATVVPPNNSCSEKRVLFRGIVVSNS
jgi:hypothetical protein